MFIIKTDKSDIYIFIYEKLWKTETKEDFNFSFTSILIVISFDQILLHPTLIVIQDMQTMHF